MATKTVPFNKIGVAGLPNELPTTSRGQGTLFQVQRCESSKGSIDEARRSETRVIARSQPKYNKQGK